MKKKEQLKKAMNIVEQVAKLDLERIEDSGNFDDLRFMIQDSKRLINGSNGS